MVHFCVYFVYFRVLDVDEVGVIVLIVELYLNVHYFHIKYLNVVVFMMRNVFA